MRGLLDIALVIACFAIAAWAELRDEENDL
jgi:hypothetical protein